MGRPKKIKDEILLNESIETQPETKKVSGKIKIVSINKNFKFSIFWLDANIEREFDIEIFETHKNLCKDFDMELKKGNLKIEY